MRTGAAIESVRETLGCVRLDISKEIECNTEIRVLVRKTLFINQRLVIKLEVEVDVLTMELDLQLKVMKLMKEKNILT